MIKEVESENSEKVKCMWVIYQREREMRRDQTSKIRKSRFQGNRGPMSHDTKIYIKDSLACFSIRSSLPVCSLNFKFRQ